MTWDELLDRDATNILFKVRDFREMGGFPGIPELLLGQMPRFRLNPQNGKDISKFCRLLAIRCKIAPQTVRGWLTGRSKPSGREHVKEIGLALDMTEAELNVLLRLVKYRPLYLKDPLDNAYILILSKQGAKSAERLRAYRTAATRVRRLRHIDKKKDADRLSPARAKMQLMRSELDQVMTNDDFRHWAESKCNLSPASALASALASAPASAPDSAPASAPAPAPDTGDSSAWDIVYYARLFLGNETIRDMWANEQVSAGVRTLLNDTGEDNPLWAKELRNRFICFGLFYNFTETDINDLLKMKGLPPLSDPESGFDAALLEAIQKAHLRYPYEFLLLLRALEKIRHIDGSAGAYTSGEKASKVLIRKAFYSDRQDGYKKRLRDAALFFNDYMNSPLFEEERVFAENAAGDHCLADYVAEVLRLVLELEQSGYGILTSDDIRKTQDFLEVLKSWPPKNGS